MAESRCAPLRDRLRGRAALTPGAVLAWLYGRPEVGRPPRRLRRGQSRDLSCQLAGLGFMVVRRLLHKPCRLEAFAFPSHSLYHFFKKKTSFEGFHPVSNKLRQRKVCRLGWRERSRDPRLLVLESALCVWL